MPINRGWKFKEFQREFNREVKVLPTIVGETARNHFLTSFTKLDGFNDRPFQSWPARKKKNGGRKLLVKTSRLKRGVRKKSIPQGVRIFNNVKYAATHNFGLNVKKRGGGSFKMPQRQFIGESNVLNKRVFKVIFNRGKALLKRVRAKG